MRARGFSLVEAIISISILLIGVLGVASLGIAMVSQARLSNSQAVATQLAREGVEVVRSIRDSNWLAAEDGTAVDFITGLSAGNDYSLAPEWDSALNVWILDFAPQTFGDCFTGFDCTRVYQNTLPPYEYAQFSSAPAATWAETPYQRVLNLFPICRSTTDELVEAPLTVDLTTCAAGEVVVGIDVQAQLQWEERGISKSSVVEEYIYDWKF
jgi:type II secretory pathway pseudopilin PulG